MTVVGAAPLPLTLRVAEKNPRSVHVTIERGYVIGVVRHKRSGGGCFVELS
jgi:hypothetical protein